MPHRLLLVGRIVLPFLLVAALIGLTDIGATFHSLLSADPALVIAALLLVQAHIVVAAIRWRVTALSLGMILPVPRAVTEYYGASLLNMILPGGVSGDILRVARNRTVEAERTDWERSAHAVFLERASGQVAFAFMAGVGLVLWMFDHGRDTPRIAFEGIVSTVLLASALALIVALLAVFARGRLRAAIGRLWQATRRALLTPRQAAIQFVLSLVVVAAYLAVFSLASRAIGAPLDMVQTLLLVPPVLLTMVLPISIGGWGVREAAAAALWPLAGYEPNAGVAASVLYGLVSTIGALPGVFAFDFPSPGTWFRRRILRRDI
ncbi:lysylphosphatidylglycerol synthase transmembrane domain-containing protein [Fulvimarina endophytica]|uniref:lysylphosphatidylglycerol synthase transmembrane domain-containing protein n=1 Tax=Fulvimarina endophytica TaxID=2293836 RepID=UPI001314A21B|nr:lysylphosphatidylglycerol synthase transmembrane domain-containing protein [Fulvimarina endophytica]